MEINLTCAERFKDARLIHNQHGKQTLKEVYDETGVSSSCIKDLETDGEPRNVGYQSIVKLAKHYGVSVDYLLGLSNTRTYNPSIRMICDYLGVSDEAVIAIHNSPDLRDLINLSVSHGIAEESRTAFLRLRTAARRRGSKLGYRKCASSGRHFTDIAPEPDDKWYAQNALSEMPSVLNAILDLYSREESMYESKYVVDTEKGGKTHAEQ